MATSFSGGRSWSTRKEPPTMGKQLVNFITCGCESSASFFVIYKAGREPNMFIKTSMNFIYEYYSNVILIWILKACSFGCLPV
jgi:hypothetical protein